MNIVPNEMGLFGFVRAFLAKSKLIGGDRLNICSILLLTLCIYFPVFFHNFQFAWDDQWVVMNDYTEGGINFENVWVILTEFYHGQYAPINELYYLTIYQVFGYNPFSFHAANIAVHVSNIILVYLVIKKLLVQSTLLSAESSIRISYIVALLFAIHPLMVEPVSWIAASKCIIFATFYLLAIYAYLKYLDTPSTSSYILVMVYFVLSFGAKEVAVTMPLCLLLIDYVLKRNLNSSEVWFEKLPFFCLAFVFVIVTFYSQAFNNEGILSERTYYPFYQNIFFAAYTVTEYVIKTILPVRLNYLYPFPNQPGELLPAYIYTYPLILMASIFLIKPFLNNRWIVFGVCFYLIQISVASNIIPTSRFAILADRYMYLPIVGVLFCMAYLFDWLLINKQRYSVLWVAIGFAYVMVLVLYSHERSKVWKDSISLKKELKENIRSRSDFKELEKKIEEAK